MGYAVVPFGHVRKMKLGKMKGLGQKQDSGRAGVKDLNSGTRTLSLSLAFLCCPSSFLSRPPQARSLWELFSELRNLTEKEFLLPDTSTALL